MGKHREFSSTRDYSHWNEEAVIIKSYEDKYDDYYAEPDYELDYEEAE